MKAKLRKIGNAKRNKIVNDYLKVEERFQFMFLAEMARVELRDYLNRTGLLTK